MRYLLLFFSCLVFYTSYTQSSPAYKDTVFTEYFRRTSGWTAGDATISVPIPCQNKTIWLFGDSFIDNVNEADTTLPCLFQVRNAMIVQDLEAQEEFKTILDTESSGVNRTPIKIDDENETFFWPRHGYSNGDTTFLLWSQRDNSLSLLGIWLATIDNRDINDASAILSFERLDLPTEDIGFGNSILVDSSRNYIYVYGSIKDWIVSRPIVARFPLGKHLTDPWEFYNGEDWTTDPYDVKQIFEVSDHVSNYTVMKFKDKYCLITQELGYLTCGLGREIYAWTSDTPYGPFKNKKLVYTIEDKYKGHYWVTYNAQAHPEFTVNNELLISYNVNGFRGNEDHPCESECEDVWHDRRHADGYRPKFVRVPLDFIDSTLTDIPDVVYSPCDRTTTISEVPAEYEVEVYPNPTEPGNIRLVAKGLKNAAIVRIFSLDKRIIEEQQITNGINTLKMPYSGVYFIKILSAEFQTTKKVIVL